MSRSSVLFVAVALVAAPSLAAQDSTSQWRPRILVANDDGFQAPGLVALVDSLATFADVVVAAPLEQQSGTGHGISFRDPISVAEFGNRYGIKWYAIGARPATVVRLALTTLLDSLPPDLVVSGINMGDNIGVSTWVSGTDAAAREGALAGIPSIAVSMDVGGSQDFAVAAGKARALIETLHSAGRLAAPLFLNVNIPAASRTPIVGIKVVPMATLLGVQRYERQVSPRGTVYYWDMGRSLPAADVPGTDQYWFEQGFITITPLSIDQTDVPRMGEIEEVVGAEEVGGGW
jgi:5'-nucleotidase